MFSVACNLLGLLANVNYAYVAVVSTGLHLIFT